MSPKGEAYDGHLVRGKKSGEVSWARETALKSSQAGWELHGLLDIPVAHSPRVFFSPRVVG